MGAKKYSFPETFAWGASTSGMQHEGSIRADGAGDSAIRRWAHTGVGKPKPDKVDWFTPPIDTFDDSAGLYERYREDIALMRQLNLRAYNFEVYWPRIFPEGTGAINEAGLAFYDRLVDEFLANDIAPMCNVYVFDHPTALQDRGGWVERDMASWYAEFASVVFERLGDRVEYWTTICELGLVSPFITGIVNESDLGRKARLTATHHLLLGQGMAVQAFRASGAKGEIGNEHNLGLYLPASDDERDVAAAERQSAASDLILLDSQLRGEYPEVLIEAYGADWPADAIRSGDLETISAPIDFFGLNYGTRQFWAHDADAPLQMKWVRFEDPMRYGDDARDSLLWIRERYGDIPIHIVEYGCSQDDKFVDGRVDDQARVDYLRDYLIGVHEAMELGVDVRGAFIWSFFDGWEFGYGLSLRYGIVYIDFETQERIVKSSGQWYAEMIAANGFD